MRIVVVFVLTLIIFQVSLCTNGFAENVDSKEMIDEYSEIYSGYISDNVGSIIDNSVSPYMDGFDLGKLLSRIATGQIPLNPKNLFNEFLLALFSEITVVFKSMIFVIGLAVLSSYINALTAGIGSRSVNYAAYYVIFIAATGISSTIFFNSIDSALMAIENMTLFMRCIVPVMITSLITIGAVISSAALEPVLLTIIELSLTLIQAVFVPLVMTGTALGVVNSLSVKLKTNGMISMIKGTVKYGLSIILTIFVAFAGLQSIAASGADGLTLKLTKFASSNLIPIVGGILSESVETVMNCSSVIKNSLGVLGLIVVFFIAVIPLIKIAASLIIFRFVAAICEPISDKCIVQCISSMADGLSMILSMLASVAVMFIIIITIMINISV